MKLSLVGTGLGSQQTEAGGLPVYSDFKASLGDIVRSYLKIESKRRPRYLYLCISQQ